MARTAGSNASARRPGLVRTAELAAVVAAAAGFTLLACARLLPRLLDRVPGTPDALLVLALLRWGCDALGSWDAFWSPPFFFPTAGVRTYADHFFGHLLLFGPLARIAGDALGYNLVLLLSFPAAALAVHVLLRHLGAAPAVAGLVAVAWALAPYRWDQIGRLQLLWVPGLPLALVAFDRLLARPAPRRAGWFLAAYALALAGGSYFAYWLHVPLAAVAALRLARTRKRLGARRGPWVLGGALAGATLLAALAFGPYLSAARAGAIVRADWEVRVLAARPESWLAPSARNVYAAAWPPSWLASERALFPGFLLAAAAALGVARWRRAGARRRLLESALLGSAALFVALSFAPVWLAATRGLPGMSSMRGPTRTYPYVLLAVAALAARGLAPWVRPSRRARACAVPAALALLVIEAWPLRLDERELPRVDTPARHREYVGALRALEHAQAVAVLPLTGDHRESRRMQPATVHGLPIVNGYSGFVAPSYAAAVARCGAGRLPVSAVCLAHLATLGVSHVVVEANPAELDRALEPAAARRARAVFRGARSIVYELSSPRPTGGARPGTAPSRPRTDAPGR